MADRDVEPADILEPPPAPPTQRSPLSAVEDIRIKLENRLVLCEQEIESLRTALDALDDEQAAANGAADAPSTTPAARRRPGRRPAAGGAPKTVKPRRNGPSSAELERLLAETGGSSAVELARQTGTDYAEVLARIRQLEQAGQSRR